MNEVSNISKRNIHNKEELDEYIDFDSVIGKDDRLPKVHPDEIYRQGNRELWDLKDKMKSRNPVYKKKSEKSQHTGLTSLRMALLTLIFRASQIAKKMRKKFYGLTLYECQKSMELCGTSGHTVRDNLRTLVDMGLLKKTVRRIEGKVNKYAFYNIDMSSFPCQDGFYIIWGGSSSKDALFFVSCPEYPHCSMRKEDCRILQHLKKLNNVLPTVIRTIKGKESTLTNTRRIKSDTQDGGSENEYEYYDDQPIWKKSEVLDQIIEWRTHQPPKSFKECMMKIRDEGILISHELIYDIYEEKEKIDEAIRDDVDENEDESEEEPEEEITDRKKSQDIMRDIIEERSRKKASDETESVSEKKDAQEKKPKIPQGDPVRLKDIDGNLRTEIEEKIKNMRSGDFPETYTDIIDTVLDEYNTEVIRFEIMDICGEF